MPPTARSSPPIAEERIFDEFDSDDDEIPSLDDIIPWSGPPRRPRQLEVFDAVHTLEDINVMFLQNVLKSYYSREGVIREVKVLSHNHSPLDKPNISQRNTLIEVNVEATVDGRKDTYNMVIKTFTSSQPVRAVSPEHSLDKREVGFYTQILDDIDTFQQQQVVSPNDYIIVPSSKCFFARYRSLSGETNQNPGQAYNISTDESVVVMENAKYQGFTHTLIDQGLSRDQVLTVFGGIARLHGLSLAMKERSGIPLHLSYTYLLCLREVTDCLVKLFDKNASEIEATLNTFGEEAIYEKVKNLRPHLEDLIDTLIQPEEPVSVLTHMNLWAHNILFKDDKCVIMDWQTITCSRPTLDLAFLLASSVKASVRKSYTREFLDHYYDIFTACTRKYGLDVQGDLEYTRESLWQDFRQSQLLAMFFWIAKSRDLIASRETETEFVNYLKDLDAQNLLEPDAIEINIPEYIYWMPRDPSRSNIVFRIERRPSDDDVDHICGLFPVYELPED